ncbi:MAG TPA: PEP-CTERM sorting domain-containing protein [Armatimonadota bacterium]
MKNHRLKPHLRLAMAALALTPLALAALSSAVRAQDALLVPDWTGKRVLSFSAQDGSLLNANFIASDGHLKQPVAAIASGAGTILVSDTLADAIFEYNLDGTYKRTLADTASSGIGHVKGIDLFNGALYAVVTSGDYALTVQKFDPTSGARLGTFASGFTNPTDVHFRSADALVSDRITTTNNVVADLSLAGVRTGNLITSDGVNGINLPYQINDAPGGHLLVGGFAQPAALYEYDAAGKQVATYGAGLGRFIRGGARLDNGNTFYTANKYVTIVDQTTGAGTDLFTSGNFQFARRVSLATVPEPSALSLIGVGLMALPALRRKRRI